MYDLFLDCGQAFLITDRSQRRYFSGVDVAEGTLLLFSDKGLYFTDARYFSALQANLNDKCIQPVLYAGKDTVKSAIADAGVKQLFIDYDKTTLTEYRTYKEFGAEIADGKDKIASLRLHKNSDEIQKIVVACDIAQKAYRKVIKTVKVGVTEIAVKRAIEEEILALGGEGPSFDIIVAFGANAAVPHHQTGKTVLKGGDAILVDMGAVYDGYCSDYTRMAYLGQPSEEFIKDYRAVLTANVLAESKIVSGMSCKDADGIARAYLTEKGVGEFFTHSLGHGVGIDIHEAPMLSPKSDGVLTDGIVFTVEPGVYKTGKYGIRIEDTVVMKDGKAVRLFTDDKDLIIL